MRANYIRARVTEFAIPPIHDALVLGRESPIGCAAIRKAWSLLVSAPYEHLELDDPVVCDVIVRASILRRIPQEELVEFVLGHIKPLMGPEDIVHIDLESEVVVEAQTPPRQ